MRVLGVDPGLTRCGLGIVEGSPGRPPTLIAVGVIRTPADLDVAKRLVLIEAGIEEWIDRAPARRGRGRAGVRAAQRADGDGHGAGVRGRDGGRRPAGLPVALHTPSEVKAAVTGSGRADKEQVTTMVTRILKLAERPTPADAADALALAICHVWRGGATNRLQEAAGSRANLEAQAQAQSRLQVARLRAAVAAQEGRR